VPHLRPSLDLNLLLTLDAVLAERNLTRAADRLGVSQPAVSAALARLRRHYGDPLLNRVGNHYELTGLASQLRAENSVALASVRRVIDASPVFDPETSEREFVLVLSDYAAAVMGTVLSRTVAQRAPGVRLRIELPTPYLVDHVAETLRAVDGFVLPHGFIHGVPHVDLFSDDWVGIVADDHPTVGGEVVLEELAGLPWVLTYDSQTAFTPAQQHLRLLGVEPKAAIVVESFLAVPFFVAGTDRVAILQRRLATRMAGLADVRTFELPFAAVNLVESFWWHPVHRGDPSHAWIRATLRAVGRLVAAAAM
jgi:DNA-binding transcriptional LysR family regulator